MLVIGFVCHPAARLKCTFIPRMPERSLIGSLRDTLSEHEWADLRSSD